MPKKKQTPSAVLPLRVPHDLLRRLDRLAAKLAAEQPGVTISRSDVARLLMSRGLDAAEKKEERRGN